MPIKFSQLSTQSIDKSIKVVGLYNDESAGISNCTIEISDFAKQSKLNEVNSSVVHIYDSEQIIGDKTFIGAAVFNNNVTFNNSARTIKEAASNSTSETLIPTIGWVNDPTTSLNVVHKSGAEEIIGYKTFTNIGAPIRFKNNNLEQMANPPEYSEQMIYGIDRNDIRIGSMGIGMDVNGNSRAYIAASKKIGDNYVYSILDTYVDKNGNVWTSAPTPAKNDNSTKIATTAWMNNFDYVVEWKQPTEEDPTWYRIYKSGWKEQGTTKLLNNGAAWTFPRAYSNTGYTIICSPYKAPTSATSDHNWIAYPLLKSLGSCTFKLWDSDGNAARNGYVMIHAMGY